MIEMNDGQMPAVGQWATVRVWDVERLCHVEFSTDGIRKAYVVTIYQGEGQQMFSAKYWRGVSDQSVEIAFAAVSQMIAEEGEPPKALPL